MTDTSELITIPEANALEIFSKENAEGLEPFMKIIRAKIDAFVPVMTTKKGRDEVASMAYKIKRSKTMIDDAGKKLVAEMKELPKKIDANRKAVRDRLDEWTTEVRQPLDDYEAKEEERVAKHVAAIAVIAKWGEMANQANVTARDLGALIHSCECAEIGKHCEEFEDEYRMTRERALTALRSTLSIREKYEADQAELAQLRKAAQERLDKEIAEQAVKDAAERAQKAQEAREREEVQRADAEAERQRLAVEAAAKAERDAAERRELALRLEIERQQREAAEAENRRRREAEEAVARAAEAERQAAAETARREADKAHMTKINRAAVAALVTGGLSEESARLAVTLIAKRAIPRITIAY